MAVTSIRNETPARLTLIGVEDKRLVLAPFEKKTISDDTAFDFGEAKHRGFVSTDEDPPRGLGLLKEIGAAAYIAAFALFAVGSVLSNVGPPGTLTPQQWVLTLWTVGVLILIVVAGVMGILATKSSARVARVAAQFTALVVILAIGVGLPGATVFFFGAGHNLLTSPRPSPLALFGRLMQLTFIALASLLPVLLFFLFDRFQLGTLRERLYGHLFRLDPSIETVSEIHAKYGSQIDEAYGPRDQGRGRLAPDSRWPVLVCAFVITIGWIVALAPVGDFEPKDRAQALEVLAPQRTSLVFGFLGVYFYSLRLIAFQYARGDLKPKAYTHIVVRIFLVAVLSWALDGIFAAESSEKLVLAFSFGVLPDAFFTWLREAFRGTVAKNVFPEPTKSPLNDLEGIDLYDRGRLESEGIVNIEGLAHHELVDLIIDTRLPVPRLIDWVDQSVLYLHLVGGSDTNMRAKLRDYGIRTATDLLCTWDQAKKRGDAEFDAFKKLLGEEKGPPYRLEVIRDALSDDEWMATVKCWRQDAVREPIELRAVPSSVEALERWADKQTEDKRYGRALSILDESLNIQDTASTRRRKARIFATSAEEYRDSARARENASRAFELAPTDYAGVLELIDIYTAIEAFEEASRMCEVALSIVSSRENSEQNRKEKKRLEGIKGQINARVTTGFGSAV